MCVRPIDAYQLMDGTITFSTQHKGGGKASNSGIKREMQFPCGHCIECKLERTRQWAVRIMHEAHNHKTSWFVTLTYDDEHNPKTLIYKHYQQFMKNLRKVYGPTRFYMCGEYGQNTDRPHYHAILFGFNPTDLKLYSAKEGKELYTSPRLEKMWGKGFVTLGQVTYQSAAYVAAYCTKKLTGPKAREHYTRLDPQTGEFYELEPEFSNMSRKPGIGKNWIEVYENDVYNYDHVIVNGRKQKPPRYYDKWLKETNPDRYESLEPNRKQRSNDNVHKNTDQQREARAAILKAKYAMKGRTL